MKGERLTKNRVEAAAPGPRTRFLWDSEVVGFGVRVSVSGIRTYVLQYRFGGRSRRMAIGRHGDPWTVETARACARMRLMELASGRDPGGEAQRRAAKPAPPPITLEALCARYLAEVGPRLAPTSRDLFRGALANHVAPRLGQRPAASIAVEDIERLVIAVAKGRTRSRGGPRAADAAAGFLSRVFVFGMRQGLCPENPVYGAPRFRRTPRQRFLDPADYARLGAALDLAEATQALPRPALAAIRLVLVSGLRPGEAVALTAGDVDFERRRVRLSGARGHQAWLSPAAADILGALPVRAESAPLFPGPAGEALSVKVLANVWTRVAAAAGLEGARLTDLRYSYGAVATGLGFSLKLVGRVMGDVDPATPGRYAEFARPEVKRASERISAEIARLIGETAHQGPSAARAGPGVDPATRALIDDLAGRTWLTTREAAARAGLTADYLGRLRAEGLGPPFRKLAWRVVYDAADLDEWISARVSGARGATSRRRLGRGRAVGRTQDKEGHA